NTLERQLAGSTGGVFRAQQRRMDPVIFRAPDRPPLGFFFYDLEPQQAQPHSFAKAVISAAHADDMAAFAPVRERGLTPFGVMPHWLGSSQQDYTDGSPATFPRPTHPPADGRWRYHYTPLDSGFAFAADGPRIPVLVLDTRPNWARAREELARFSQNA